MIKPSDMLLLNIKANLPALEKLAEDLVTMDDRESFGEDCVYRYYHNSFKVFNLQTITKDIVAMLEKIKPFEQLGLSELFTTIVDRGTGKVFKPATNMRWIEETSPIVEAYFHASYFLQMAIKYGKQLNKAPDLLPTGWAALLELYGIR